ncbi:MAG: outer membrane lipoprotein carrier protein LolA [Deltaproteobacteria bacterium]|nr:outer membrane lipoprotein carrier protein LolA [Deltaproteobacteria bacterium]
MRCLFLPRALALIPVLLWTTTAVGQDPWQVLEETRRSLVAAGPTVADFDQTFLFPGSKTPERESGEIALNLPDCLRWDYAAAYGESYLLCHDELHTWIEEDQVGQRYEVDVNNEPGLDLLLLTTEELRQRYRADAETLDSGEITIALQPVAEGSSIQRARLTVKPQDKRLASLEYVNAEGGTTRFDLSAYRPASETQTFVPPKGIQWTPQGSP